MSTVPISEGVLRLRVPQRSRAALQMFRYWVSVEAELSQKHLLPKFGTAVQGNGLSWHPGTFLQWLHTLFQRISLWLPTCRRADRAYLAFSQHWKLLIKGENMKGLKTRGASQLWAALELGGWIALTASRRPEILGISQGHSRGRAEQLKPGVWMILSGE